VEVLIDYTFPANGTYRDEGFFLGHDALVPFGTLVSVIEAMHGYSSPVFCVVMKKWNGLLFRQTGGKEGRKETNYRNISYFPRKTIFKVEVGVKTRVA
jgi:hypothetical protein